MTPGRKPFLHAPKSALNLLKVLWSLSNDAVLNIRTMPRSFSVEPIEPAALVRPDQPNTKSIHSDPRLYESPDYWNLRKIAMQSKLSNEDVVYDIGAGKGRVLCVFARHHVKRCVGIELYEPLCEIARYNAQRLRGRRAPIEIRCQDAAKADYDDGTIYFMFNPFGPDTLQTVIHRIVASLEKHPRGVTIVYYNEQHGAILASSNVLRRVDEFRTFSGVRVSFWSNVGGSTMESQQGVRARNSDGAAEMILGRMRHRLLRWLPQMWPTGDR